MRLEVGKRIIVKPIVLGRAAQGTYVDQAHDKLSDLFIVRLDNTANGREYMVLKENEFYFY